MSVCSSITMQFSQLPLAALPTVLSHNGAITVSMVYDYSRGITANLKSFTHQSAIPHKPPVQELK
jgi:hypothetical protein